MNPPPVSPAGFWKRYVAYSIDVLLLSFVCQLVLTIVFAIMGLNDDSLVPRLLAMAADPEALDTDAALSLLTGLWPLLWRMSWISTLVYALIAGVYFVGMESSAWRASLGKRLLGLVVLDGQGQALTPWRAAARFFAAALSWLTLNLGHALAAWTPSKRALHDFVAGTRVEHANPTQTTMPAWAWAFLGLQALLLFGTVIVLSVALALWLTAVGLV
ncbi:RDD family protein [Arenimonas oryziterrae]|uniref:RDD domain-containing protein n=1 Tax=Arenimonas oryziterrae DSM 21050 = YC6267 TaxID=1121015 RepID=A0A091AYT6_9GAMM|nr:RDD family protein [Arenimonas oryziterrae]KFN43839.1 hypothetical protein N789_07790 [Arenimonas oryziterrae DSM 21050 = YC6267]